MKRQRILRGQLVKALLLDFITKPESSMVLTSQIYDPVDAQSLPRVKEIFIRYHRAGVIDRYALRVRQALAELDRRGLIRLRPYTNTALTIQQLLALPNPGYKVELVVTEAGQRLAYRHALVTLAISAQSRWDGLWRIVGLDIPETKKSLRDTVRQLLKRLGFKLMQRSLWVIPWPCKGELNVIKAAFDLKQMMWSIEAKTIDREGELLVQFRLRR